MLFLFHTVLVEMKICLLVPFPPRAICSLLRIKPRTDEHVFLDKFLDEFTYPYVRRTSFPRQVFLDKLYLFLCTRNFVFYLQLKYFKFRCKVHYLQSIVFEYLQTVFAFSLHNNSYIMLPFKVAKLREGQSSFKSSSNSSYSLFFLFLSLYSVMFVFHKLSLDSKLLIKCLRQCLRKKLPC